MNRSIIAVCASALCAFGCGSSSDASSTGGGTQGGTIKFSASGEVLALGGYDFPPATMDDAAFVDGWAIKFDEFLVTVDKIKISENPDMNPGDQSQVGMLVGEVDGPWAIDLHTGGPLPGKGGGDEQALPFAELDNENMNGNAAFDPTQRYAFGFDLVTATKDAKMVNLTTDQQKADYATMQKEGYVVYYSGTATFKGTDCTPSTGFDDIPKTVRFHLGFKSPTSYINCQNPDNDPAKPLGDEEHERGIFVKANTQTIAQVTVHTDHPFWESFIHDSPAHFDMLAAQHQGESGTPTATMDDVKGIDPTAITKKDGSPLNWRTCDKFYTPPAMGQMSFDTQGIQVDPKGDPSKVIRDLYDFMTYNQSTQGHLNSDGLCFVDRHYPSPE